MAYCTIEQLKERKGEKRIAELTGDPDGTTVSEAAANQALNEFAAKMDVSIRKQYPSLPFNEEHLYLNGLNIEGAYLILERDSQRGWTDHYRADWKLLLKELEAIAAGDVDLVDRTEEEAEEYEDGFFRSNRRLFGRNSLSPEL